MHALMQFLGRPRTPSSEWMEVLAVISIIAVVLLVWQLRALLVRIAALPRREPFKAREVMTKNEVEFFQRLKRALPDFEVFGQTAMSALIEPVVDRSNKQYWAYRKQFAQKVCDYVISHKGCPVGKGVIAVIELDDRTHDKEKDARRDAMLLSAGICTLRYESRAKPSEKKIRQDVLALVSKKR